MGRAARRRAPARRRRDDRLGSTAARRSTGAPAGSAARPTATCCASCAPPADALLVGPGTLIAERYATLLDPEQRQLRAARGLSERAARGDDLALARPAPGGRAAARRARRRGSRSTPRPPASSPAAGAAGAVIASARSRSAPARCLVDLATAARRARWSSTEGGPTLLRELVADGLVDDLVLTARAVPRRRRGPLGAARRRRSTRRCSMSPARGAARRGPPVPALRARRRRESPPATAPDLRAGERTLRFERGRPLVMGIVNAGPRLVLRQRAPRHASSARSSTR